jgi:hypothetical protein
MSVLSCNRYGCENIMCDRYNPAYGYICEPCFNELVESRSLDIKSFMLSHKEHPTNPDTYSIINDIFPFTS